MEYFFEEDEMKPDDLYEPEQIQLNGMFSGTYERVRFYSILVSRSRKIDVH